MDLGLDGRVAVVTGASIGIGRAIAETLSREGCRLALVARGRDRLERAADELAATIGARPLVVAEDVTADGAAARIREATLAADGPADILVNNAGGSRPLTGLGTREEQGARQEGFEGSDALADGRLGAMKLFRRLDEAPVPGRGLERLQAAQRGKVPHEAVEPTYEMGGF